MGDEISHSHFTRAEEKEYRRRLAQETATLAEWFTEQRFSRRTPVAGCELEAWLVDEQGSPAPINEAFLARLGDALVVPELSRFNVEFNTPPQDLQGTCLASMEAALSETWRAGVRAAADLDARLLMIGILPTLRESQLSLANMSPLKRYRALNAQVLRLRGGAPLELDIHGREQLRTQHGNVMLEAATTSFQIHLKVGLAEAVRSYNAAILVSAPLVAVSANSPFLFGRDLWDETRIPLFEQSVAVGGFAGVAKGPLRRVSFGTGYARHSLLECFVENEQHFPVMLPILYDEEDVTLPHLRLHNGTIWRWNRPLLGFDADGTPHLRVEHRVIPGGPTLADEVANMAFFYGLVAALVQAESAPEAALSFPAARDNFYAAARDGLESTITWLDGKRHGMAWLVRERLLPLAAQGLEKLGIEGRQADHYLDIIERRVANGCTGAGWQRAFVARHGRDMASLTQAYWERQESGLPVHEWDS
ncbi:MAG: glutamate--cysteine ligase [Gammaproteobacteria bacterium]|nr:glutamate--cysteine ligase [Gammaproteobacteria bacterium]